MSTTTTRRPALRRTEHSTTVAAPAHYVLRLLSDVSRWPQVFSPTLHVDLVERPGGEQLLRSWALAHGQARHWLTRRLVDHGRGMVSFRQLDATPPLVSLAGRWQVRPRAGSRTSVALAHDFQVVEDEPESVRRVTEAIERNGTEELAAVRMALETADEPDTVVKVRSETMTDLPAHLVYDRVERADEWPERHERVAQAQLTDVGTGVQLLALSLDGGDGTAEPITAARLRLPERRTIVHKRLPPHPGLRAHTGRWTVQADGPLTRVTSSHVVRLDPAQLGPGTRRPGGLAEVRLQVRAHVVATDEIVVGCVTRADSGRDVRWRTARE